jgi:hypothetical protein
MANQDDFVKTALRLPRDLHAAIRAAAEGASKSMNSEIIGRLQESLRAAEAGSILERLNSRESQLLEANEKQIDLLWSLLDRADGAIRRCSTLIEESEGWHGAPELQRDVAVLLELISAVSLHRQR